jgi:hypothetical protein
MSTLEVGKIVPATGTAITLGDSGDTFTIPASATLDVNGIIDLTGATKTSFPSITTASQWRLTTDFTGGVTPIATNLEEVDGPVGFGVLGSSMTQSSGIFTFPSTGYWMIKFDTVSSAAARVAYNKSIIMTTTNDSTYVEAAWAMAFNVSSPATYSSSSVVYIMDVTSTSTHKVRFDVAVASGTTTWMGDTDHNETCMTFIKLADT